MKLQQRLNRKNYRFKQSKKLLRVAHIDMIHILFQVCSGQCVPVACLFVHLHKFISLPICLLKVSRSLRYLNALFVQTFVYLIRFII